MLNNIGSFITSGLTSGIQLPDIGLDKVIGSIDIPEISINNLVSDGMSKIEETFSDGESKASNSFSNSKNKFNSTISTGTKMFNKIKF